MTTTIRGHKPNDWEIRHAISLLEDCGYIVRKPSEADIPTVLEVEDRQVSSWELMIRADTKINGVPYALRKGFPIDLVLNQDDDHFRKTALPRILGDELGYYIAGKLAASIAAQVEAKIESLVPEKRMSLDEIVTHLAMALGTSKHRIEPKFYDENDQRRPS